MAGVLALVAVVSFQAGAGRFSPAGISYLVGEPPPELVVHAPPLREVKSNAPFSFLMVMFDVPRAVTARPTGAGRH